MLLALLILVRNGRPIFRTGSAPKGLIARFCLDPQPTGEPAVFQKPMNWVATCKGTDKGTNIPFSVPL